MMSPNQFTENTITVINLAVDISKGNMQQKYKTWKLLALGLLMQNDGLIPRVVKNEFEFAIYHFWIRKRYE